MSIHKPPADWCRMPTGAERTWIGLAFIWCIVLFVMMPYWHFKGKQNSTGESYRVDGPAFIERVNAFVETNQVGEEKGMPVCEPAPGGDAYLLARMWQFYPVLRFKKDQTYRLHISSPDLNHGLSIQPMNMNFQIVPGYDHVITVTPTQAGTYSVICNEFCGIGHHLMTGRILVTE
jgi:cytochrome c oxidase subunit 2